jgi:hypothetical protein
MDDFFWQHLILSSCLALLCSVLVAWRLYRRKALRFTLLTLVTGVMLYGFLVGITVKYCLIDQKNLIIIPALLWMLCGGGFRSLVMRSEMITTRDLLIGGCYGIPMWFFLLMLMAGLIGHIK